MRQKPWNPRNFLPAKISTLKVVYIFFDKKVSGDNTLGGVVTCARSENLAIRKKGIMRKWVVKDSKFYNRLQYRDIEM